MRTQSGPIALILILFAASEASSQATEVDRVGSAVVTQWPGPSVQISSGLRVISARSSLALTWLVVNDSSLGLIFDGPVGTRGYFDDSWYHFGADLRMTALEPVTAFEVRVITFDVWGTFTGTLAFSQLEDLRAGQKKSFGRAWGYLSESDVRDHFTSIAYVAKVKRMDGSVVLADPTPALRAAQRIKASISLQDLEPRREPGVRGTVQTTLP